jgi:hypothetical protein
MHARNILPGALAVKKCCLQRSHHEIPGHDPQFIADGHARQRPAPESARGVQRLSIAAWEDSAPNSSALTPRCSAHKRNRGPRATSPSSTCTLISLSPSRPRSLRFAEPTVHQVHFGRKCPVRQPYRVLGLANRLPCRSKGLLPVKMDGDFSMWTRWSSGREPLRFLRPPVCPVGKPFGESTPLAIGASTTRTHTIAQHHGSVARTDGNTHSPTAIP